MLLTSCAIICATGHPPCFAAVPAASNRPPPPAPRSSRTLSCGRGAALLGLAEALPLQARTLGDLNHLDDSR